MSRGERARRASRHIHRASGEKRSACTGPCGCCGCAERRARVVAALKGNAESEAEFKLMLRYVFAGA